MRQGNDFGTQYRSAIYTTSDEQAADAQTTCRNFQAGLTAAGYGTITTEIAPLDTFFIAEEYHQKYLAKNPDGYCGIRGTGVTCASGV
jgi:peptide-methionine (S)-S-oxide reductase